ncbi:hypothetical protein LX32DRAFT_628648 [Colletotrichum zoysiae]|uniref:Uncharacterized protein n=1 Tax=Colletotrichum zoysiae TaxID=1216348 RepID=A0AAD9H893_9PEZI|nr:hypothetical protein LX32DRAFT_628648 [Colletotrichum zoysiae]
MGDLVSSTSVIANGTASLSGSKSLSPGTTTGSNIQTSSVTLTSGSTATASSTVTGSGTLTDEPHVTLTTLPPGVSLLTLERVTYTSPTYITTTSPGSNHPTIVPIIIPFTGPPMICFNCFITFPPNIQIDVPQFCIQLFGLKIGNCPPKEDNKGNQKDDKKDEKKDDKEGDKDDEDKDEDEKPTKSEQEATTTSTSSSCTVTITATHRSVFCPVTKGNSADASCSTTAYTTATECSALGKTTTVTTTETPTPVVPPCGPDTCGGQVCPVKREIRPVPAAKDLLKRGNPQLGRWPDPSDYPDHKGFIADQIQEIAQGTEDRPRYSPKLVHHFGGYPLSAGWVRFKSKVEALALQGLYGCTSIVLVSRRGAWVSHIWETVLLNTDPFTSFNQMVDGYLPRGITPSDPNHKYYEYGMAELKDHPELGEAGVMFGDDPQGTDTPSSLNMRAFIVTPRARMSPYIYREPDGRVIPHDVLNQIHHQRGTIRMPERVERLKQEIANLFGDIPLEVLDYNAYVPKPEHTTKWERGKIMTDDAGNEYNLRDYMALMCRNTVRGKFLLQYQPAGTCKEEAEWRLWFEGQPVGDRSDGWRPLRNQLFAPPGLVTQPGRRQESVCEVPAKDAPPAASPTSAGGSATPPVSHPASVVPGTRASWSSPLPGNRTLSSSQTLPAVSVTLPSASASRIVYPPGSNPILPTTRTNTTTLQASVTTRSPLEPTTIFKTVEVTVKRPTTRSEGLTAIPITSSTPPVTASTAKATSSSRTAAKTTSRPPGPEPSRAVAIYYVDTVMRDYNGMLAIEGAWWMFPVGLKGRDRVDHDPCGKEPQGWMFLETPLNLQTVPWPPSLSAEGFFFDQRYCKYKEGKGGKGFGALACEGVAEFACERDPRAANRLECSKDPAAERTFVARVLCRFPTTDHRPDAGEAEATSWVTTKVPLLAPTAQPSASKASEIWLHIPDGHMPPP